MYSNMRSVQILVSLLRRFEIKDIVISSGGSSIPIVHSIETDVFFQCHSVVDERSAAYFAMGLAQEKGRPVACICTSGTAVCNYLPGITEAFYQNVPVVAITADKNPYFQGQLELQKIDQGHIFAGVVKKSVTLPLIQTKEDEWLTNRLINEALLELDHHGAGPVHINIPIVGAMDIFDRSELPEERKIDRIDAFSSEAEWTDRAEELRCAKRVMVVVGQNVHISQRLTSLMNRFFEKYNCMYAVEHLSNVDCQGAIHTYPLTEMGGGSALKALLPDLVISLGNNLAAYKLKPFLRDHHNQVKNWLISESGLVRDAYKSLRCIFECAPVSFFEKMIEYANESCVNDMAYHDLWAERLSRVSIPEFDYWNFMVGKELSNIIPENAILHLAILNAARIMQFFSLKKNVKVYCNVGALGIDGCFSSFAGQAAASDRLAYLLIGDLSFFYDMNAASLRSIGKNVRVVLINNAGGSEFHFFMGKERIPTINDFISVRNGRVAEGWIRSLGYDYYSAHNGEELKTALSSFGEPSERPLFLEVFTDMEDDAKQTKRLYAENSLDLEAGGKAVGAIKNIARSVLSPKQVQEVKRILKK